MAYKGMFWDNVGGSKDRHMRIQKHRDFIVVVLLEERREEDS